jgi:hypothetical protein
MGIQAQAAKIQRSTETTPLDLDRLRHDTAQLQALIAEATSLVRRALGQSCRSQPAGGTILSATEPEQESEMWS